MLVPCPHCNVHVKSAERRCPHCGESLRRADGSIARTAAAIVLGLAASGCGEETPPDVPAYGVPDVSAQSTTTSGQGGSSQGGASQGGASSQGGAGGEAGAGGMLNMPAYGVAGFQQ